MRNKVLYILFFCLLLVKVKGHAQESEDTILLQNFSAAFLDKLLFEEVNQQRLNLNIPKLFVSEELMTDSKAHSTKMMQDAAISYSSTRAGECILTMKVAPKSQTYSDLATAIIRKWMNSPGHSKLIMGDFFLYGGVGTDYQPTKDGQLLLMATFQVSYF